MSDARIPDNFHFIWGLKRRPEPFHLVHYLCLASCLEVNRPAVVKLHAARMPRGRWWERIRDRVTLVEANAPEEGSRLVYPDRSTRRFRYAHAADFLRLDLLLEEGGVYADIDTLFVKPYPLTLYEQPFVIGREPDIVDADGVTWPSLCNALLMAAPGSSFARAWRSRMEESFDGSWSRHSTLLPAQLGRRLPGDVHIEPQRSFFRYDWSREGLADLFERRVYDLEGVYSIHLWAHLWWSRRRRDFSRFHAGMLNEEYVRCGETTYAAAARRFLP